MPPLAPQSLVVMPNSQTWLASQQPVHWSDGHCPPQPSSPPWHLPAHFGVQQLPWYPTWPVGQQVEPAHWADGQQVPVDPPQQTLPETAQFAA